jgi:hypothetical protein
MPPLPPRRKLGRIEQIGLELALRRGALGLAAGTLVLILAGMPTPSGVLGWFGLVLIGFVFAMVVPGWYRYARGVPLRAAVREHRILAASTGLLALATLLLTVWTVVIALGGRTLTPLEAVLGASVLAGMFAGFGLWRGSRTPR